MAKETSDKLTIVPKENYIQLLNETCIIIKKMHTEILSNYHKLGEKVADLTGRPDKYGQHTVQMLSQDLAQKGINLGPDSLYDAQLIFKQISPKQLKMAKEAGLPLRKTLLLCRKSVDDDTRQSVIEEAYAARNNEGKFDVDTAIKERTGAAPSTGTVVPDAEKDVKRAAKIIKSAEKLVNDVEQKLKEVGVCVEEICRGDSEDRIRAAYADFDAANLAIDSLVEIWRSQVNRANKVFKTVEAIINE